MAVAEDGWGSGAGVQPVGIDKRVNVALDQPHIVQPDLAQVIDQPLSGAAHILLVRGECADTRDPQPLLQFFQLARAGRVQVSGEAARVFF